MDDEVLLGDEGNEVMEDGKPKAMCDKGIVTIDNFNQYHGNYLARMAREAYGAGVVSALSEYVTGFLYMYQEQYEIGRFSSSLYYCFIIYFF